MYKVRRSPAWILALLLGCIATGCGVPKLRSKALDCGIVVDGDHSEWRDAVYAVDGFDGAIGFRNDASWLYLCLSTADSALMREVMLGGFTIWFDPEGGKARSLGIQFPLSAREAIPTPDSPQSRFDLDAWVRAQRGPDREIVIHQGDDGGKRMFAVEAAGIDLAVGQTDGALVYELRVPLAREGRWPFAIGVSPGESVGVGLFTSGAGHRAGDGRRIEPIGPPGSPEGGPGDGLGRRGERGEGGGRGRGRGLRRGPRGARPEPLQVWMRVELSTGPTPGAPAS